MKVFHPTEQGTTYEGEPVDCREMMQLHGYVAQDPFAPKPGVAALPTEETAPGNAAATQEQLHAALAVLPDQVKRGEFKDADSCVDTLRTVFGDLLTADNEASVRALFAPVATGKKR